TPQVVLTELETKIINEIVINKKISRSQLAEKLGISQDTIKEYIEKLKKRRLLNGEEKPVAVIGRFFNLKVSFFVSSHR
ncbi:MAG: winged helix-turn-helix domain-containing protein, partial [Thermoplasmata archaeon]|nr:winged helix-turn-helix domain-containing protein [Thermoplasmata archaeon]